MHGYLGRLLRVDLDAERVWEEPLNEAYARRHVGGSGLAARYLSDLVEPTTAPLAPENPLIFMTGPLVGTTMPSAGRYTVASLSPATGFWGEANAGGFFGPELRFAGYDGIIITGRAERPVWLSVTSSKAALHSGDELCGLDTYATQAAVKGLLSEPRARVAVIGVAGENLVPMAGIFNDHGRAAARCGLGAVMGAKRLKAVAVRGTGAVPVANPDGLREATKAALAWSKEDLSVLALRLAGTAGYVDMGHMLGDLPIRYFQLGEWEGAGQISGVTLAERLLVRARACFRCPIACGRETRAPRFGVDRVDGPEYETVAALGSLLQVDDLEAVVHAGHLCNELGLDTISVGSTIALACRLVEAGVARREDFGDLAIGFGEAGMLPALIEGIARRKGAAELLAEGSDALARRFGVPEMAVTTNGLEVPMHDPRAYAGMAAVYALSPRGACHTQGDLFALDSGQAVVAELGLEPGDRFATNEAKGRVAARQMAWRSLYDSLGLCHFQNPGLPVVLAALNAVTGWDLCPPDLLRLGQNNLDLKRRLNLRRGWRPEDEALPVALLTSLRRGGTQGHVPDLAAQLRGAYAELGWDRDPGDPPAES